MVKYRKVNSFTIASWTKQFYYTEKTTPKKLSSKECLPEESSDNLYQNIKFGWTNIIHNNELLITNSKKKILPKTSEVILALRPMKVKGLFFDLTVNSEAISRYYFYWQISDVLLKIKTIHLHTMNWDNFQPMASCHWSNSDPKVSKNAKIINW